jgi:muramoyltetrapeptide carboxypeptidase
MKARIVAPSSKLGDLDKLQAGLELLSSWGIQLELAAITDRSWHYLAGSDAERLADFDGCADLWACARGGWGAARLLERGWQPPQGLLLGFSDITTLLWAKQAAAANYQGALHGPLVTTLAAEPSWSQSRLRDLLQGKSLVPLHGEGWGGGVAEGPLLVANLTVATHLLGTPWCPDLEGAVLILEDVSEAPYRIDRMLTHWRLCGALQKLAAIGFGDFTDCGEDFELVLQERTASLGIPRMARLPVGHGSCNAVLPLGQIARLDADQGLLSLAPP